MSIKFFKVIILITLIGILWYLMPSVIDFMGYDINLTLEDIFSEDYKNSLINTIGFASISSLLTVIISFFLSLFFVRINVNSRLSYVISIFLVTFTLGNLSVTYMFKNILTNSEIFNYIITSGKTLQFLLLFLLNLWQYLFFFTYLFWINHQQMRGSRLNYMHSYELTFLEKIKHFYLPNSKNLSYLLIILSFIFSIYEDSKIRFIFKSSAGVNTELINTFLSRTYHSNLLNNIQYANSNAFIYSFISFILFIISLIIIVLFVNLLIQSSKRTLTTFSKVIFFKNSIKLNPIFSLIVNVFLLLIPFILIISKVAGIPLELDETFYLTLFSCLIASLIVVVFSISFSIILRLSLKNSLSEFNMKSLPIFIFLLIIILIPPLLISINGFGWLAIVGVTNDISIYFVWLTCHIILLFPLLTSFLITIHFSVRNNELDFHRANKSSSYEIMKYSFIKRFPLQYALTLIIAFALIWNEGYINSIFSDFIPSFASYFEMSFIGRAENTNLSLGYFYFSILLSVIFIIVWNIVIYNSAKKSRYGSN